jgi:heme-degrading monooxygenase HmoA
MHRRNLASSRCHATAQQYGKEKWYSDYRVTIARVERSYGKPLA